MVQQKTNRRAQATGEPTKRVIAYRPLRRKFDPPDDPSVNLPPEATMYFCDFADLYLRDMKQRWKSSTWFRKESLIRTHLSAFFGEMRLYAISAADVRRWQNALLESVQTNGRKYSPAYLRHLQAELSGVFSYAVRFFGLPENPCLKAGNFAAASRPEMQFWTQSEFLQFIEALRGRPDSFAAFMTLYYTGIREGELLALTQKDIDFSASLLSINKTYQRINRTDVVTSPKTRKSNRTVTLPAQLIDCLANYLRWLPPLNPTDRIFPYTKDFLYREMAYGCEKSGVKRIRVHDIRHSHASLLVELGFSPLLIAERLGHEKVQTTMNIYSHLYPNKQAELAAALETMMLKSPNAQTHTRRDHE